MQKQRNSDRQDLLVVDDEAVMVAFLETYLSRQFRITTCNSAVIANEQLESGFRPDIILLDLQMPQMDGFELIRSIRKKPHLTRTPIVVLSGSNKSSDRVDCLRLGADDFVVKPFNPDELEIRLTKLTMSNPAKTQYVHA